MIIHHPLCQLLPSPFTYGHPCWIFKDTWYHPSR